MRLIFKNSDGWKDIIPRLIHLDDPPSDTPILGQKTNPVNSKATKRIGKDHFFIFANGRKKHNPPSSNPGKYPNLI